MRCRKCQGPLLPEDRDLFCMMCGRRYYADPPEALPPHRALPPHAVKIQRWQEKAALVNPDANRDDEAKRLGVNRRTINKWLEQARAVEE